MTTFSTNVEIATAYEKFNDTENVDISLLLCGYLKQVVDATGDTKATVLWILQLQEKIVWHLFHSKADVVNVANVRYTNTNVVGFVDGLLSSSYLLLIVVTNKCTTRYNDVFRFVY